jgi:hypothetical protein
LKKGCNRLQSVAVASKDERTFVEFPTLNARGQSDVPRRRIDRKSQIRNRKSLPPKHPWIGAVQTELDNSFIEERTFLFSA